MLNALSRPNLESIVSIPLVDKTISKIKEYPITSVFLGGSGVGVTFTDADFGILSLLTLGIPPTLAHIAERVDKRNFKKKVKRDLVRGIVSKKDLRYSSKLVKELVSNIAQDNGLDPHSFTGVEVADISGVGKNQVNGYIKVLNMHFGDEGSVKLIHKVGTRESVYGARASDFLHEEGLNVPKAYLTNTKLGSFIEYVEGQDIDTRSGEKIRDATLVERIFDSLESIHNVTISRSNLKEFGRHKSALMTLDRMKKKFGEDSNTNTAFYSRYKHVIDEAPAPTLIHGDFNPGNVVIDGEDISFLDFDYSCMGNPYFDFFYFCEWSGFCESVDYETIRQRYISRIKENHGISDADISLAEFDFHLANIMRFTSKIDSDSNVNKEVLSVGAKNELQRCRRSLEKYVAHGGDKLLAQSFNAYASENFSYLDLVESDLEDVTFYETFREYRSDLNEANNFSPRNMQGHENSIKGFASEILHPTLYIGGGVLSALAVGSIGGIEFYLGNFDSASRFFDLQRWLTLPTLLYYAFDCYSTNIIQDSELKLEKLGRIRNQV